MRWREYFNFIKLEKKIYNDIKYRYREFKFDGFKIIALNH